MNDSTINKKANEFFQRMSDLLMKSQREDFLLMRLSTMYKGAAAIFLCYIQPFLVLFFGALFLFCLITFYKKRLIGIFHAILFLSNFLEIIAQLLNLPISFIFVFFSDIRIPMPYPACFIYYNMSGPYRTILHIAAQHLNVLLCFNRIVAVYKPFKLKYWFSKKKTTIYCGVIIAFIVVTGLVLTHILPGVTTRKWVDDIWGTGKFGVYSVCSLEDVYRSSVLQTSLNLVYLSFVIFSTVAMIAMNIALFKKMQQIAKRQRDLREGNNQNVHEERRANAMNRVAVLTIMTLTIIEIPHLFLKGYALYSSFQIHLFDDLATSNHNVLVEQISSIVVECLYPLDLALFVLISKKMRKEMLHSICNILTYCKIKKTK